MDFFKAAKLPAFLLSFQRVHRMSPDQPFYHGTAFCQNRFFYQKPLGQAGQPPRFPPLYDPLYDRFMAVSWPLHGRFIAVSWPVFGVLHGPKSPDKNSRMKKTGRPSSDAPRKKERPGHSPPALKRKV
jgi:hypothetical protein